MVEAFYTQTLLYRTDQAKICQPKQFRQGIYLLYRTPYRMALEGVTGIGTGIDYIEIFIAITEW